MQRPNIFWISIDSLRRDFLSVYNQQRTCYTYLDELAEQGCIFENAFPGGNWTMPSHATMLSGLDITSHMIWSWAHRFAAETQTAFDIFHKSGYSTGCFAIPELRDLFSRHLVDSSGQADSPLLFKTLDTDNPFFVFWHTYNVHYPYGIKAPKYFDLDADEVDYDAGGPTMSYLRHLIATGRTDLITDAYGSEIQRAARFIRGVASKLKRLGKFENTYFIITADHGEAWRLNGLFHCNFVEEVLQVPLAITGPEILPSRVRSLVSLSSLLPTVMELCGLNTEDYEMFDGESLRPLIDGAQPEERPLVIGGPDGIRSKYNYIAVRQSNWMLIKALDFYTESFHRVEDGGISVDLSFCQIPEAGLRVREELRSIADRHADRLLSNTANKVALSTDTQKKLRALGYV